MWCDVITIYHKIGERKYNRTELSDCEWQGEVKVAVSERGTVYANYTELYIRDAQPEISVGDFIVKGRCFETVKSAADIRSLGLTMMTVQGIVSYADHMEVTGA